MRHLYSFFIAFFNFILPVLGIFSSKLKTFRVARRGVFDVLKSEIANGDRVIWLHAASLGEYEQAVPVLEQLRADYKAHKILLTFFSPSGYEIKKNSSLADVVTYLPLDTQRNAKQFIGIVKPELAIFVKYEFWPNYLYALKKSKVHTVLISGVFRTSQLFFKFYGSWMKKSLEAFNHFFLQNYSSLENLKKLGFENAVVSGDTRFDRVSRQLSYDNTLPFITEFKKQETLLVCGSTWPEDIDLLAGFINGSNQMKTVIAPHKIDKERIEVLQNAITKKSVLYSEYQKGATLDVDVLIIDAIGFLTKIYAYADLAYLGGAAGTTGLHNILEPATFGVPIITGSHISKFPEAQDLRKLAGLFTVSSQEEAHEILNQLVTDKSFREKTGMIAGHFISENTGATRQICDYLTNQTLTA